MFSRLMRVLFDSLIYGTGNMLQPLLTFLLLPVYTQYLDKREYGLLAMLAILPVIYVTLAASGMKSAIFRFYYDVDDPAQRRRMLSTALWSIAFNTLVLLAVGIVLAPIFANWLIDAKYDLAVATNLVQWSFLSAATVVLAEVPRNVLQIARRVKATSFINGLNSLITVLTTLYLVVVTRSGIHGVVWGNMLGNFVGMVLMYALTFREYRFVFDVPEWKRMSRYALPFLPHRLQAVGMTFLGDYLIKTYLGLDQTGLYNVAGRLAVPMMFASTALQTAWGPYKFKIYAEDSQAGQFFRSAFTYLLAGTLFLWVGLAAVGPDVLRLMTAPQFHEAASLIWAIGFSRACQSICPLVATGIELATKTTRMPIASFFGLVVVVIGCFTLIPPFHATGAALATGFGWLALAAGYYWISQRQLYIPYDWRAILSLVALAGICVGISIAAQGLRLPLRMAAVVAICGAFPLGSLFILSQSPTERPRMIQLWRSTFQKWGRHGADHPVV